MKYISAAGFCAVAISVHAQILNPGFETAADLASGAGDWTLTQAAGGPVYGVRTNTLPRSGSWHFEVRLASTGAGPVVQVAQTGIPVTGGTIYPFTFYSRAAAGSAGYNAQWRVLWNAGGDTGFRGFTPGANVYAMTSNSITAPVGATSASLYFYFAGAATPTQSATIQLDDISWGNNDGGGNTNTNVVIQPFSASISLVKGISFESQSGVIYQVQWAASDVGPDTAWNNLGAAIPGSNATITVHDALPASTRIYRVLGIQ